MLGLQLHKKQEN